jgi:hypothetical protein
MKSKLIKFFKRYPELLTIPAGFIVWMLSVHVLRFFDPTSGVFDAGVFQIPIFAIIQFFVYVSIAWLMLGVIFGTFKKYLLNEMKYDFRKLEPWQKLKLSYSVFFLLVVLLAYLARTLVTG